MALAPSTQASPQSGLAEIIQLPHEHDPAGTHGRHRRRRPARADVRDRCSPARLPRPRSRSDSRCSPLRPGRRDVEVCVLPTTISTRLAGSLAPSTSSPSSSRTSRRKRCASSPRSGPSIRRRTSSTPVRDIGCARREFLRAGPASRWPRYRPIGERRSNCGSVLLRRAGNAGDPENGRLRLRRQGTGADRVARARSTTPGAGWAGPSACSSAAGAVRQGDLRHLRLAGASPANVAGASGPSKTSTPGTSSTSPPHRPTSRRSSAAQAVELTRSIAAKLDVVGADHRGSGVRGRRGSAGQRKLAPAAAWSTSGHYTVDACVSDQFEQQLRAVCGLPLGDERLVQPAAMANLLGDLWQAGELRLGRRPWRSPT